MEHATKTRPYSIWQPCCRPAEYAVHLKNACAMAVVLDISASNTELSERPIFVRESLPDLPRMKN